MAQSGQCKPANSGLPTSTQFCFPGKTDITQTYGNECYRPKADTGQRALLSQNIEHAALW